MLHRHCVTSFNRLLILLVCWRAYNCAKIAHYAIKTRQAIYGDGSLFACCTASSSKFIVAYTCLGSSNLAHLHKRCSSEWASKDTIPSQQVTCRAALKFEISIWGTMNPYHNFIRGYDEKPKKLIGVTFEEAITIAGKILFNWQL